jgi:hypothetical protein
MLNTKRIELTPKLSMDMVSPPWKLLFEAHSKLKGRVLAA